MQSLLPAPIQLLLLLRVRVLSWRRRLAATLRKPSELAGVLVTLAFLSFVAVRVWRVDWTVNGPAVLRLFAWYIVILTGIAVVLRAGHILRKGVRPLEPWEVLGGSSEVDRLVDLMSWAAWIGVAYGVLFLQLAPAVAAGSPIAMRLVALAPGLWISGVVLGEWAGLIVSILASLVARLRVTRAASVVAAMVLGLAIAWPFAARAGQLVEMVSIAAQGNEIPWHYSLWAVPLGFFALVGSAVLWRGLGSWMTHSDTYATDLGPAAFRGSGSLIWTGALLAMRTTWRTLVILAGFSVLIGIISRGVEELDGRPQAILFVVILTSVLLWTFSRRMRDELTPQHRFLRERPGSLTRADWRQLVAGQAVVPGILGAAAYLIVAAFHIGHETPWIFVVLGLGAAELGFSFGVAAHYLSGDSTNTVVSIVLFIGAGVVLLVFWMVRMILFLGAPPLVLVQGLGVGYAVVHVAGRHPRRWAKAHLTSGAHTEKR